MRRAQAVALVLAARQLIACGGELPGDAARSSEPVVYGPDHRLEVFEASALAALAANSTAAFIARAHFAGDELAANSPTVGEEHKTCRAGRFDHQPSVAFCTAVLVERDLVLTAGHCLRSFALDEFFVVFGYVVTAQNGKLASLEVARAAEIVEERLHTAGITPRLDHAWVRLDRRISSRFHPAPLRLTPPIAGEPLTVVSAAQGAPLKADEGGVVRTFDPVVADTFVANTDTFRGSSGAGAFDAEGAVLGILARGAADYVSEEDTPCVALSELEDDAAAEQYSRADAALHSLCARAPTASTLCRPDCGPTCTALDDELSAPDLAGTACAIRAGSPGGGRSTAWQTLLLVASASFAMRGRMRWRSTIAHWRR